MSSSASSSTAGNNAAGTAATSQSGQSGEVGHATDGSGHANSASGPGGNIVEKQQSGGGVAGHAGTEPRTSSPAHHRNGGGGVVGTGGSTTSSTTTTGTVLRRKTNVCLICGIYTNLSLNIFEPRNGPNIVDVIYEKYKFRAERGDNADKHICFSCNNWLINWYSLQNTSSGSSRTYEPAPSTSRSSSAAADSSNNSRHGRHHTHKPRTKSHYRSMSFASDSSNDKENRQQKAQKSQPQTSNPEQHGQISSTTNTPSEDYTRSPQSNRSVHPYSKTKNSFASSRRSLVLKEKNGQRGEAPNDGWWKQHEGGKQDSDNVVSSSTAEQTLDPYTILVKPFENRLIQMLEGQGTSVTKESAAPSNTRPWTPRAMIDSANGNNVTVVQRRSFDVNGNVASVAPNDADEDGTKEIVISFDTALSEVIDVVPSLKAIQSWNVEPVKSLSMDPVRSLHQRLSSGSLTVSVIGGTVLE
uniref:ZAD domain-containing protein n=1 Tax=Anopheles funestus TaxID=62324 RepID=A0A182RLS9_ANOFN